MYTMFSRRDFLKTIGMSFPIAVIGKSILSEPVSSGFHSLLEWGSLPPGSDWSTLLQTAINDVGTLHGILYIPGGYYNISQTIIINQLMTLVGDGRTGFSDISSNILGTQFTWIGTAGGTMFDVRPDSGVNNPVLNGVKILDIGLFGAQLSGIGLAVRSVRDGMFRVSLEGHNGSALYLQVMTSLGEARDIQNCEFDIVAKQLGESNGPVIFADGLPPSGNQQYANVSKNIFTKVWAQHRYNHAIVLAGTDCNFFPMTTLYGFAPGVNSRGVVLKKATSAQLAAHYNHFDYLYTNGGIYAEGSAGGYYPSVHNEITSYDVQNGCPAPVREGGAILRCRGNNNVNV